MPNTPIKVEAMERLKDEQGLTDCFSAHTLIEVGEIDEAIEFCNSILRQPAKNLTDLQTRAYLTILVACIDDKGKGDKDIQLKKARKLWQRIKKEHDNAVGISGETREISKKNNDMKWQGVMDSLDDTEQSFKEQINDAKLPLQSKIEVLENEIVVAKGKITLLQDQSAYRQETIEILQAEVALLKSRPLSEYTQSSGTSGSPFLTKPPARKWMPFLLSLCFGSVSDSYDSDKVPSATRNAHPHRPSMIFDNKLRYSTSTYQTMTAEQYSSAESSPSNGQASSSGQPLQLSDLDRLMMNGPILVRPGRPLAYVDDTGNIVEVDVEIKDLPPMMFPHQTMNTAASNVSLAAGRPKTMGY